MKTYLFWLLLGTIGVAAAQPGATGRQAPAPAFTLGCATEQPASPLQKVHCETRTLTLPAPPAGTPLVVQARAGGSLAVRAWAGPDVRVRARVTGRAATAELARAQVATLRLRPTGTTLEANTGPAAGTWEVSYEVLVPPQTDMRLSTENGLLTLENVRGNLRLTTAAGPLALRGVGGDVRGTTGTGNLKISLNGTAWQGSGLELTTTAGNIDWQLPADYAATVLARSTRGRVTAALNTKRLNLLPHSLAATLGKGGAQLKASSSSGNVQVAQPAPVTPPVDSLDAK